MHARNADKVLPDPVGAEISVERPATICGHPSCWGSVGVPNLRTNHSCTRGWAQESEAGASMVKFDVTGNLGSPFLPISPKYTNCVKSSSWRAYLLPNQVWSRARRTG